MSAEQAAIAKVSVLAEEVRARLFAFARHARRPVTRVEAASALGISANLAGFHLDKLVEAGLLTGRTSAPGVLRRVGRAPKYYEATGEFTVSIPPRRPELLAEILAEAVAEEAGEPAPSHTAFDRALAIAAKRGRALGTSQREAERPGRLGVERALTLACERLEDAGFEPERTSPRLVRLRNCPFHPLAARQTDLVCGINQAFLAGYLDGLEAPRNTAAVRVSASDSCCVELRDQRD